MKKKIDPAKAISDVIRKAEITLLHTKPGDVIDFNLMKKGDSYGQITPDMESIIKLYIKDRIVYDFGAGSCSLSIEMVRMGAKMVYAIDKNIGSLEDEKMVKISMAFDEHLAIRPLVKDDSIAFISWPANYPMKGLLESLEVFKTIIYIGKNTDGSSCAWPVFFGLMMSRKLLEHIPDKQNTMLIWGEGMGNATRPPVKEERAGMDRIKCYSFD